MDGFRIIDGITSDVGFEAEGRSLGELAENSAKALFSIICEISRVGKKERAGFEVRAENAEALLYDFLSRLVAESDIKDMFFSGFEVSVEKAGGALALKCACFGEEKSRDKSGTMVKAVTLHQFRLKEENGRFLLRAYVDI